MAPSLKPDLLPFKHLLVPRLFYLFYYLCTFFEGWLVQHTGKVIIHVSLWCLHNSPLLLMDLILSFISCFSLPYVVKTLWYSDVIFQPHNDWDDILTPASQGESSVVFSLQFSLSIFPIFIAHHHFPFHTPLLYGHGGFSFCFCSM